jgi:hypothetical protein
LRTKVKIIRTARMPDLMLICEEVALIFGQHDVANCGNAKLGLTIVQLGRAEAVSVDLVAQRGTVTMLGSRDLKSQLENTFGLGVADANDARYTFGDPHIAADLAKLEHPGSPLVRAGRDTRIVPGKAWWVETRARQRRPTRLAGTTAGGATNEPDTSVWTPHPSQRRSSDRPGPPRRSPRRRPASSACRRRPSSASHDHTKNDPPSTHCPNGQFLPS